MEGCAVHHERWTFDGQSVLLVHGRGASSRWWEQVRPLLTGAEVAALDLTGHGRSEWRPAYRPEVWAAEVAAVAGQMGHRKVILVGHSMGGRVAIATAARHPECVSGLVLLDTLVRDEDRVRTSTPRPPRGTRTYATREEALAAFRIRRNALPVDPNVVLSLAEYVVRRGPDGWFLAVDPRARDVFSDRVTRDQLATIEVPVFLAYGERSHLNIHDMFQRMEALIPTLADVHLFADSGHQLPLETPDETARTIRSAMAQLAG